MSAFSLGKQVASAFNREKPNVSADGVGIQFSSDDHPPKSSITQWVEILTSTNYEDEAYDG